MKSELLSRLQALRGAGTAVALVTRLADGTASLVGEGFQQGDLALAEPARRRVLDMLAADTSGDIDGGLFVRAFQRPVRLIVVGAVHIAQALVRMAGLAGFECVVVDPRAAFGSRARFEDVSLITTWPDAALAALVPDGRTAVVTLTHDPKLDEPALRTALSGAAFYVGALGSRKTHAARIERLRAAGVSDAELSRIRAPVGLPLGGRRPGEIAVSIMAEIIQSLYASRKTGDAA